MLPQAQLQIKHTTLHRAAAERGPTGKILASSFLGFKDTARSKRRLAHMAGLTAASSKRTQWHQHRGLGLRASLKLGKAFKLRSKALGKASLLG